MWRYVILAICAYVLYKMFLGDRKHKAAQKAAQPTPAAPAAPGEEMVKDPICGAYVSKEGNIRVRDGETVLHFCSYDCRDVYVKQIEERRAIGGGENKG